MPAKNTALTLTYTAWDTANQVGKTGDGANHTLKVVVDGTEAAVTGSITEVDSTSCKGEYKVTLTSGQMNGNMIKFCGVSSTSGIIIVPIPIFTDGGVLPATAAPGASGGLLIAGSNAATTCATFTVTGAFTNNGVVDVSQTGDTYARLGANGAGLTALAPASTALTTATWTNTLASDLGAIYAKLPTNNIADETLVIASTGAILTAVGTPMQAGSYTAPPSAGTITTAVVAGMAAAPVGSVTGSVGSVLGAVASVTAPVIAGTVTDKTGYGINLSQTGLAPRSLDAVADASLTIGDALVCAISGAAGKEAVSGTNYTVKTPFTGTVIRTFALDSASAPTSRS